jgi:hypothetical protein
MKDKDAFDETMDDDREYLGPNELYEKEASDIEKLIAERLFMFCKKNKDFPYDLANNSDDLGLDEFKPFLVFAMNVVRAVDCEAEL